MDEKQQVVFAALIHHVGIFFTLANNKAIIDNTKTFCDKLCVHNPALKSATLWRELAIVDENTKNQTTLQKLILAAHKFSISEQIGQNNTSNPYYLQPILEKVNLPEINQDGTVKPVIPNSVKHHLPLKSLSLEHNNIYPTDKKENNPQAQYQNLLNEFWTAFDKMPHFKNDEKNTLAHLTYNLLNLFEQFFSQTPALKNVNLSADISLFDHLRVKAAIAEGLYEYHQQNSDNANFENEKTEKWSLICGDFSGIQKFIYNIVQKNAAKALRGRSLYIQLLCDSIAQHLIQKLDLFYTCQIYSSGGKFYLLIPVNKVQNLKDEVTKVNRWLLNEFRGLIFLGIGHTPVIAENFHGGKMGKKWKETNDSLMRDRSQRFRAVMNNNFFEPIDLYITKNKQEKPYCEVCGRDDKTMQLETNDERHICGQCKLLEELGRKLSNPEHYPHYFLWDWEKKLQTNLSNEDKFSLFSCDLYIVRTENIRNLNKNITAEHGYFLEVINQPNYIGFREFNEQNEQIDVIFKHLNRNSRLIGLWDTTKTSWDYDFEMFAENSQNQAGDNGGIKRLGILRMDVDNLGQVFVNGLNFEKQQMGSLSRIATLSRQLNLFFSGYLKKLLETYQRTQIIYAGGDDLFLIGSWDELPDVANEIRNEFSKYCAGNHNFTLSGGMAMVRGKYPISRAANLAGGEEEKAKKLKYACTNSKQKCQKNAFCFLETPIAWEIYEGIENFKNLLLEIIEDSDGSHAIINRLRDVVVAMQEFERLSKKDDKKMEEIQKLVMHQKWRWRLLYNIARMESRYPKLTKEKLAKLTDSIINNRIDGKTLPLPPSHWLPLPVRWAEFLTRKGRT